MWQQSCYGVDFSGTKKGIEGANASQDAIIKALSSAGYWKVYSLVGLQITCRYSFKGRTNQLTILIENSTTS